MSKESPSESKSSKAIDGVSMEMPERSRIKEMDNLKWSIQAKKIKELYQEQLNAAL